MHHGVTVGKITVDGDDEMEDGKEGSVKDGAPDEGDHAVDVDHLEEKDVTNGDNHCPNCRGKRSTCTCEF